MTRILVVEDEDSFSDALSFLLGKEGFEVKVAADGVSALEIFAREGADLVLLDLMLPGVSGTEVCRQLRLKSAVPIIMLTARTEEVDRVLGLELGADDYLPKPFNDRELVARIRAILRRSNWSEQQQQQAPQGPPTVGYVVVRTPFRPLATFLRQTTFLPYLIPGIAFAVSYLRVGGTRPASPVTRAISFMRRRPFFRPSSA